MVPWYPVNILRMIGKERMRLRVCRSSQIATWMYPLPQSTIKPSKQRSLEDLRSWFYERTLLVSLLVSSFWFSTSLDDHRCLGNRGNTAGGARDLWLVWSANAQPGTTLDLKSRHVDHASWSSFKRLHSNGCPGVHVYPSLYFTIKNFPMFHGEILAVGGFKFQTALVSMWKTPAGMMKFRARQPFLSP